MLKIDRIVDDRAEWKAEYMTRVIALTAYFLNDFFLITEILLFDLEHFIDVEVVFMVLQILCFTFLFLDEEIEVVLQFMIFAFF